MSQAGLIPLGELEPDERVLFEAAREVAERAHAPYSRYRVGASIRAADGRVFSGCNVENASYGASMCAERSAVFGMVSAGAQRISAVCVYSPGEPLAMPCGICRQVLAEFCPDAPVLVAGPGGALRRRLAELLPEAFRLDPGSGP